MTLETLRVIDDALACYHDRLRFYSNTQAYAKGHATRNDAARKLWHLRKAMIELGLYRVSYAPIVLPLASECE